MKKYEFNLCYKCNNEREKYIGPHNLLEQLDLTLITRMKQNQFVCTYIVVNHRQK